MYLAHHELESRFVITIIIIIITIISIIVATIITIIIIVIIIKTSCPLPHAVSWALSG